jgi:hypothetical protein
MSDVPIRPQAREAMADAIEDLLVQLGVENPRERGPYDEEGHLLSTTPDSPAEIVSAAAVEAFLAWLKGPDRAEQEAMEAQVRWRKLEERAVAAEAERDALREALKDALGVMETAVQEMHPAERTRNVMLIGDRADDMIAAFRPRIRRFRRLLAASVSKEETRDAD